MSNPDPEIELSVAAFRGQMADTLDAVMFDGARIKITRRGRVVAVLTPPGDLTRLREGDAVRDMDAKLDHARMLERWERVHREAEDEQNAEKVRRDQIVRRPV